MRLIVGRIGAARAARRLGRAALLAAVALVAACATPTMRSEVARFHGWQAAEPLSFAFRTAGEPGSLEHRSYAQRVRERLLALGFSEAPPGAARYEVAMSWQATPEARRVTDWWPPPGAYPFTPYPWLGARPIGPGWRYDPWWGIPPTPLVRDITLFRHELRVDLYDVRVEAAPGRKVFEARAATYAENEAMPRLMPGLVEAVFAEFPGESGTSRRVEVPLPDRRTTR